MNNMNNFGIPNINQSTRQIGPYSNNPKPTSKYSASNTNLPVPVLASFTTFGM